MLSLQKAGNVRCFGLIFRSRHPTCHLAADIWILRFGSEPPFSPSLSFPDTRPPPSQSNSYARPAHIPVLTG
jgi:hypothetical protein